MLLFFFFFKCNDLIKLASLLYLSIYRKKGEYVTASFMPINWI